MQREESVVAVVCHGFLISSLFGHSDIGKTVDVKPGDLDQVKLTSVPNCAVHEVVASQPADQDDADLEFYLYFDGQ